jgi:DNA invertase Pin-like site-specific DNA recombinase
VEDELGESGEIAELRAALYVRTATQHPQYSTDTQSDKIRDYASKHGIEIVKTYTDEGKSGLSIFGRTGFQKLLSDVDSGRADFNLILVYDISRWGRFLDSGEGAYYEYICRRAGIQVTYCAEQCGDDSASVSTIVRAIKRSMADEYKRELSVMIDQAPDMPPTPF